MTYTWIRTNRRLWPQTTSHPCDTDSWKQGSTRFMCQPGSPSLCLRQYGTIAIRRYVATHPTRNAKKNGKNHWLCYQGIKKSSPMSTQILPITDIPFQDWLHHNTKGLCQWIIDLENKKQLTEYIQLTSYQRVVNKDFQPPWPHYIIYTRISSIGTSATLMLPIQVCYYFINGYCLSFYLCWCSHVVIRTVAVKSKVLDKLIIITDLFYSCQQ
jgi:hypothetical protein